MKVIYCLLLVCGMGTQPLWAQTSLDSLQSLLGGTLPDTQKVQVLVQIGNQTLADDVEAANAYFDEAYALADRLAYRKGLNELGMAYNILAAAYGDRGELSRCKRYYQKALGIFERIENSYAAATLSANVADIYLEQDSNLLAEQYYQQALPVLAAAGDRQGYLQVQLKRGINLSLQQKYSAVCRLLEPLQNEMGTAGDIHMQQTCFAVLSDAFAERKKYQEAYTYSVKAAMATDNIHARELEAFREMMGEMEAFYENRIRELEASSDQSTEKSPVKTPKKKE